MSTDSSGSKIAVIGLSGRFPGAPTLDVFWSNLRNGVESVRAFSRDELLAAGLSADRIDDPHYVPASPVLDDIDRFDPAVFGLPPQEAAIMDPQQRIFLEEAWSSVEHAGYDSTRYNGAIGVFAGCGMNTYFIDHLLTNPALMRDFGFFHVRHTGNDKDFLATRLAYAMDLTGPSVSVQTACSTSLVAVHLAVQSLLSYECDMAVAGGSTIDLRSRWGYRFQDGGILAPDGHCRPFDVNAQGTLFGSGAGAVVLKRYADALEDGDTIHAVILGSAINNDGASKANYFAPSVDGQAAAVAEAVALAGIPADSVSYIETHGTGTPIGDPIEVAALRMVYGADSTRRNACGLGSVKSNIGHLDTAAGVAGLIKAVLALKHRTLPPTINFTAPNPKLELDGGPFYIQDRLQSWLAGASPRRAAVNSLGVGGTNAHVILEEFQPSSGTNDRNSGDGQQQVFVLSGLSSEAVLDASSQLADAFEASLDADTPLPLNDVAFTLQEGRRVFPHRAAVSAADVPTAIRRLRALSSLDVRDATTSKSVAFMFPGGGAQHPQMGRGLYDTEPVYRSVVDECLTILQQRESLNLRPVLFPQPHEVEEATTRMQQPSIALPALLTTEIAMARLLLSWGIEPEVMVGHSAGEYAAAHIADVMSLGDALSLITLRGRLFETLSDGGMLSVGLSEADLRPLLGRDLSIAAINGPERCVASGPARRIDDLERLLRARGVDVHRVKIDVAAHSSMVEPILDRFRAFVRTVDLQPPTRTLLSDSTGDVLHPEEAVQPEYWVQHIRNPVRFSDALHTLFEGPASILLEVGPGQTLSTLADLHQDRPDTCTPFATMRHPKDQEADDVGVALAAVGGAWAAGVPVDFSVFRGEDDQPRRIPLPTYPFQRRSCWVEPGSVQYENEDADLTRKGSVDEFTYAPTWKPTAPLGPVRSEENGLCLVFRDRSGLTDALLDADAPDGPLAGVEVVTVDAGDAFAQLAEDRFVIRPDAAEDYARLTKALGDRQDSVARIVHAWNVTPASDSRDHEARTPSSNGSDGTHSEENEALGWRSLFLMAKAFGESWMTSTPQIAILANHLVALPGERGIQPQKATLFGPARVIPREYEGVSCRVIDVDLDTDQLDRGSQRRLVKSLRAEVLADADVDVVALRRGQRFVQTLERMPLGDVEVELGEQIRPDGTYVITGGLGGLGLAFAKRLAELGPIRLVLLNRTALPPRADWDRWVTEHAPGEWTSTRIQAIREMEATGAQIIPVAADVANEAEVRRELARVEQNHGPIRGLIHAAGVLSDSLLAMKSEAVVENVLRPKVDGTAVLQRVLGDDLDFAVLFSSVSSLLGLPGQVDYCAANAYLDAAAHAWSERGVAAVAIGWNAWQHIGMASTLGTRGTEALELAAGRPIQHDILERWVSGQEQDVFWGRLDASRHWVLDGHRLHTGEAVLPGTAYLELVASALSVLGGSDACAIEEIYYEIPMIVEPSAEVKLTLRPDGDRYRFTVEGRPSDEDAWTVHATGQASDAPAAAPETSLDTIRAAFSDAPIWVENDAPISHQHRIIDFGERWSGLQSIRVRPGDGASVAEALGSATLPSREDGMPADDGQRLHTALLDVATGYALPLVPGYTEAPTGYVPLTYSGVRVYAPLPASVWSYARLTDVRQGETATFAITIYDPKGRVIVDVDAFTMRAVPFEVFTNAGTEADGSATGRPTPAANAAEAGGKGRGPDASSAKQPTTLQPEEGKILFDRILASGAGPHILVSTVDLPAWKRQVDAESRTGGSAGDTTDDGETWADRPDAPATATERGVAEVWQSLLGRSDFGRSDDLFDLGGTSLTALRMLAALRRKFDVTLNVNDTYFYPTIASMASYIDGTDVPDARPAEREGAGTNGASHQEHSRGDDARPDGQEQASNDLEAQLRKIGIF